VETGGREPLLAGNVVVGQRQAQRGSFLPGILRLLGAIAQLGERLLCKQEVTGSIPVGSISPDILGHV
jgi:hypothetical protein